MVNPLDRLYNETHYPQSHPANINDPYKILRDRARKDGVSLYTAGTVTTQPAVQHAIAPTASAPQKRAGTYSVGSALFKAAMIMLCFVAFESLVVFFIKDYLNIPAYYPAIPFGIGFIVFITCAILYARNYRPNARRKRHPSYLVTMTVLFVISIIIVTMIAVYLKAQISDPAQLLSYVIVPIIYLANMMVFATFYYMFSVHESYNR